MSSDKEIKDVLSEFCSVNLEQLKEVSLMNRMDLKYVFSLELLPRLLKELLKDYCVLEIGDSRSQKYETLYFDTADLSMYHMHHRGAVNRHKVRLRKYKSSDTVFLEVKMKDNKGMREKSRVECDELNGMVLSNEEAFLSTHTPFEQEALFPVIKNSFNRITLANIADKERVTIDFNLKLKHVSLKNEYELPGVAIAEIKKEGVVYNSHMNSALKKYNVHPMRFSKYCIGVAKTDPMVVSNRFKEVIRKVDVLNMNEVH